MKNKNEGWLARGGWPDLTSKYRRASAFWPLHSHTQASTFWPLHRHTQASAFWPLHRHTQAVT